MYTYCLKVKTFIFISNLLISLNYETNMKIIWHIYGWWWFINEGEKDGLHVLISFSTFHVGKKLYNFIQKSLLRPKMLISFGFFFSLPRFSVEEDLWIHLLPLSKLFFFFFSIGYSVSEDFFDWRHSLCFRSFQKHQWPRVYLFIRKGYLFVPLSSNLSWFKLLGCSAC